jgi:phospholipase C
VDESAGAATAVSAPPEWDRAVTRPATDHAANDARGDCTFARGALPGETLGAELPVDADIPIENVVVVMQENRSFDSYYGHLNKYAGRTDPKDPNWVESAPEDASNPENILFPDGPRHPWKHADQLCFPDTNHEWKGTHVAWDDGRMDGFFMANHTFHDGPQPTFWPFEGAENGGPPVRWGERALWWYDERDIPFYYELASTFTIADHYHSSVLGPTWPNRDYLYAATSLGKTTGKSPDIRGYDFPGGKDLTIFDMLERRHVSWKIYIDDVPHIPRVATLIGASFLSRWGDVNQHFGRMGDFFDDSKSGRLPQVTFVDGKVIEDVHGNDEHPPGDIQQGEKLVSDVVHSLFASPQWKHLAMFLVYDEHGGLYDHVEPPRACVPDDVAPQFETNEDREYEGLSVTDPSDERSKYGSTNTFDRLGVRVPLIVVSPYAKRGYVTHDVYDHTSIARFIEAKFKLPALTRRDANALPPYDAFDFTNAPFLTPPNIRAATIDQNRMDRCALYWQQDDPFNPPQSSINP